jgi:hypothetical protein
MCLPSLYEKDNYALLEMQRKNHVRLVHRINYIPLCGK